MSEQFKIHGRLLTKEQVDDEIARFGKVKTAAELAIEKAQEANRRIGQLLLVNQDARLLMDILEQQFFRGDLVGKDPHDTYYKLGQRDVVKYLLDLRDREAKEK